MSASLPSCVAPPGQAEPEVLLHRELGEDPPPLGNQRDPGARDRLGLRLAASVPASRISPCAHGDRAHDRVQRRRLARRRSGRSDRRSRPSPTSSERSRTRRDAAVAHLERRRRSSTAAHSARPPGRPSRRGTPRRHRGSPRISAGVPAASVRPWSSTWMRSHTSMISAMLWSIRSTPASCSSRTDADDRRELGHLRLGQAGGRLVHQHEERLGRERARHAEPALVAVRERAGRHVRAARSPSRRAARPRGARASRGRAPDPERRDLDVLAHATARGTSGCAGTCGRAPPGRGGAGSSG